MQHHPTQHINSKCVIDGWGPRTQSRLSNWWASNPGVLHGKEEFAVGLINILGFTWPCSGSSVYFLTKPSFSKSPANLAQPEPPCAIYDHCDMTGNYSIHYFTGGFFFTRILSGKLSQDPLLPSGFLLIISCGPPPAPCFLDSSSNCPWCLLNWSLFSTETPRRHLPFVIVPSDVVFLLLLLCFVFFSPFYLG